MSTNTETDARPWVLSFQFQRLIAEHPAEFRLGYVEGDGGRGVPCESNPEGPRGQAYELGRALRRGVWA